MNTILFIALLSAASQAETYNTDLVIPATPPTNNNALIAGRMFSGVATGFGTHTIPSDWSYVTCEVNNGNVEVLFVGDKDNWPASIPSQATCQKDGYTLIINIVSADLYPPGSPHQISPALDGVVMHLSPGTLGVQVHTLPASDYIQGEQSAYLNGGEWLHVSCSVQEDRYGSPVVYVQASSEAASGSGTCMLERSNAEPLEFGVTLFR